MDITYVVTADASNLRGWTPESLAAAIREPLAEIGIAVECQPHQHSGGGLRGLADDDSTLELAETAWRIVAEIATETEGAG